MSASEDPDASEIFGDRIIKASFNGDFLIVPSGKIYFEEREASRDGKRFTLLAEARHNDRDINAAKRILRNSRDAVAIIVEREPS